MLGSRIQKLRFMQPISSPHIDTLWRELDKHSNTLLDVGCGEGGIVAAIKRIGTDSNHLLNRNKIGLDLFRPCLERCKNKRIYDSYVLADTRHLPFKNKSTDAVLVFDLIEHLKKKEGESLIESLEEITRRQVIIFTPVGFLPQMSSDNPHQVHKSGWLPKEFKMRGYHVRGVRGIAIITRVAHFHWVKSILGMVALVLALLTQPIVYLIPRLAFQMICIKNLWEYKVCARA